MNRILRLFLLVQVVVCVLGTLGCGDEESSNPCEDAKRIRMNAIQSKCSEMNLQGCCYCGCELGTLPAGCSCENYNGILTSQTDTTVCEGATLTGAYNCIEDEANCADQTKTSVQLKCN